MKVRSLSIVLSAALVAVTAAGCATKKYVKEETGAVNSRVDQVQGQVERGMEARIGESQPGGVRSLVGDPARIDGGHENAVLLQHFSGAGAGEHVQRGLRHVGVRMPRALVGTAELPLHGRHIHDVRAAGR